MRLNEPKWTQKDQKGLENTERALQIQKGQLAMREGGKWGQWAETEINRNKTDLYFI